MNKIEVYFEDSHGNSKYIGCCSEIMGAQFPEFNNCLTIIKDFINLHNFKSYYTRITGPFIMDGHNAWSFDVGSWSESFTARDTGKEWDLKGLMLKEEFDKEKQHE